MTLCTIKAVVTHAAVEVDTYNRLVLYPRGAGRGLRRFGQQQLFPGSYLVQRLFLGCRQLDFGPFHRVS
jgi:hypothetical protein